MTTDLLTDNDLANLEKRTYSPEAMGTSLTPELLGRMVAWVLQLHGDQENTGGSNPEKMFQFLVHPRSPMPDSLARVIHIQNRVDGPHIEEMTRMLLGAQSSFTLGRLNPDTTAPVYKLDGFLAERALGAYRNFFPDEIAWLKREIASKEAVAH